MKRRHPAVVAAVAAPALALATPAVDASAQEAAAPQAAQAASAPAPAPGASAVRIHVRTLKNKGTARLYVHRADGSYTLVCASPCTADLPGNSELRVTLANKDDEPHTFTLPSDLGSEVDLEVRPASSGPLIGSIVLLGSGGAFMLTGLAFVALSDLAGSGISGGSTSTARRERDVASTYKTTGFVMLGLGAAAAVAGFVWLLSRSHEPQVIDAPYREPQVYGRRETLLVDVALGKPRDPPSDAPLPFMPLQYGFTF